MPYQSNAQRKLFHVRFPRLAKEWDKHTPEGEKLPEKVKEPKK